MNKIAYLSFVLGFTVHCICQSQVQRVRLIFESPTGYVRHLLLGFDPTNTATDGVDPGWDTLVFDDIPGDLNWLIEGDRYVVQGVGEFDNTKKYPFGLYLTYPGDFNVILGSLENFESEIEVYIYDTVLDTYTQINEVKYTSYMPSGDYLYRYYIAFSKPSLSVNDQHKLKSKVEYRRDYREISITTYNSAIIKSVSAYTILGQKIVALQDINASSLKIPVKQIHSNVLLVNIETTKGTITKKIVVE